MAKKTQNQPAPEGSPKKKKTSKRKVRVQTPYLIALSLCFALGLVLTLVFLSPLTRDEPRPDQTGTQACQSYKGQPLTDIEAKISQTDRVLLQRFKAAGIGLRLARVEDRTRSGKTYHYQELLLAAPAQVTGLPQALGQDLKGQEGVQLDYAGNATWEISTLGVITHRLRFSRQVPAGRSKPVQGRLAIVIDDLGEDLDKARRLIQLGLPLTFSVLPRCTHSNEISDLATQSGLELILHQPMEPLDYPKIDPGPGALLVGMDQAKVQGIIAANLEQVPQAVGMNNHMGSRFTSSRQGMLTALAEIQGRQLFFLDSLTSPDSVARQAAHQTQTPYLRRNIFLDNTREPQAISYQLQKAEQLALSQGQAIAIGHPYEATLQALAEWQHHRDTRVELATLSELILTNRL